MTPRQGDGGRSRVDLHPNATRPHLNIKERVWDVAAGTNPVAGLVIIHGGNWHSGWFGELGDMLSSESYRIRVSAPDLPSHGLSDDVVPPYRAYLPDFGEHANEACAAVRRARSSLPEGCPVFLLGESMGGTVALQALALNDEEALSVSGLLLCGAVIRPAAEVLPPPGVLQVLKLVGWFFPTMRIPSEGVGGKTFDEAFGDLTIAPVARADPLVTQDDSPRIAYGTSFLAVASMLAKEGHDKINVKSVFMMHYNEDGRAQYAPTRALVDSLKTEDKEIITLEGTCHQAFQDTPEKSREHGEMVARFIVERARK